MGNKVSLEENMIELRLVSKQMVGQVVVACGAVVAFGRSQVVLLLYLKSLLV